MSYDVTVVFDEIWRRLSRVPLTSIECISSELGISRGTIEKAIKRCSGKTFRALQREALLLRVTTLVSSDAPLLSVKEIAFAVGYQSPRSFARAIRRASGLSPQALRHHAAIKSGRWTSEASVADADAARTDGDK